MRLLNIETRELEEYFDNFPAYAILSHTWGAEEITLQDLKHPDHIKKRGYVKLNGFCVLAAKLGYKYVWIDTCCIDKTNSAELSEAINSMFRWYADAPVCCAYLEDVTEGGHQQSEAQFRSSRWFTRGWTLQELIAPQRVDFYDSTWSCFGDRHSLAETIKAITNIPISYLCNHLTFRSAMFAER
nr:het domain-containing protein [Colletotrichum truncatum]KAF6797270.1 het domain-containing protein [Colletotrichum truncatum]